MEELALEKEAPTAQKSRPILLWCVIVVVLVVAIAVGWHIMTRPKGPLITAQPEAVRAKIPSAPQAITEPQSVPDLPEPETSEAAQVASVPTEPQAPETNLSQLASDSQADTTPAPAGSEEESIATEPAAPAKIEQTVAVAQTDPPQTLASEQDKPSPEQLPEPPPNAEDEGSSASIENSPQAASDTAMAQTTVSDSAALWTIQVGAFRVKQNAEGQMIRLNAKGYGAYVMETEDANQRPWFNVRCGHFDNRQDAKAFLEEVKAKENLVGIIIRPNP